MSSSYRISYHPDSHDFANFVAWLKLEYASTGEGFYGNIPFITSHFERDTIAMIFDAQSPVGFICWNTMHEVTAEITYFGVKIEFRRKGIGKYFIREIFKHLVHNGIYLSYLTTIFRISTKFWRIIGFENFAKETRLARYPSQCLFLRLIPFTRQMIGKGSFLSSVELWDRAPADSHGFQPKWCWDVSSSYPGDILGNPIIQPIDGEWRIKMTIGGEIKIDEKLKYFEATTSFRLVYGDLKNAPSLIQYASECLFVTFQILIHPFSRCFLKMSLGEYFNDFKLISNYSMNVQDRSKLFC